MCKIIAIANQKGGVGKDYNNIKFGRGFGKRRKEGTFNRCGSSGKFDN